MLSECLLEDHQERYQFSWPDKRKAMIAVNQPTTMTLRPILEKSVDFGRTKNIYIEGDNLDALRVLREAYLEKIKLIYIDPPYNTGNDFVYNDTFETDSNSYENISGQLDEYGNKLVRNLETNGRFHTDWLNMIYPRIRIARDLLTKDGSIFISIGEDELANLTKICDEIFGEQNYVATICVKSRASVSNDKVISPNENYILFYAKDFETLYLKRHDIGLEPLLEGFDSDDRDGKGPYKLVPVDGPGGAKKGNPYFAFLGVEGYFRFSKETMERMHRDGLIVKKGNSLYQKYYLSKAKDSRRTATTWWDDVGLTSSATANLKKLMGGAYFDSPKPIELVDRILRMMTNDDPNAIIMDFFSGSGTTAESLMRYNSENSGKRSYILVQLPEICDPETDAYKAGFRTICDIGEERIRKAARNIGSKPTLFSSDLDLGVRVFKLDSSNMTDVFYKPLEAQQSLLADNISNIKPDRTSLDLLFQVMLDLGLQLSAHIEEIEISNRQAFVVDDSFLVACFADRVNDEIIKKIAKMKPIYAVFRDSSFASDSANINCEQLFKAISPTTELKVI